MPAPIHLERYWLMDAFGCFLQYDSTSQQLITTQFTPQSFPNLFTFAPVPAKFPHRAILRLKDSIPSAIPNCQFVKAGEHAIAIRNLESQCYLCSISGEATTSWHAEQINAWEHFTLLNNDMITGLSILGDPDISRCFIGNETVSNLTFKRTEANMGMIGEVHIKIAENLSEISKLAKCPPHQEVTLSFQTFHAEEERLSVKVIPQRSIHLTTSLH